MCHSGYRENYFFLFWMFYSSGTWRLTYHMNFIKALSFAQFGLAILENVIADINYYLIIKLVRQTKYIQLCAQLKN